MKEEIKKVKRGEVYFANLPDSRNGSIQAGKRPVVVVQTEQLNRHSPTVIVSIITSSIKKTDQNTHVVLPMIHGLPKKSMVEAEQTTTISKDMLTTKMCELDEPTMKQVDKALCAALLGNRRGRRIRRK